MTSSVPTRPFPGELARAHAKAVAVGPAQYGLIDRMPGSTGLRLLPPTRVRWAVLWLFALGIGLFGVLGSWAAIAPIKSAVVASGAFRVSGDRLVVQHLEGGIVADIRVSEGALVAAGDVIAVLQDTRAQAGVDILQNQLVSALAMQARLQAEFADLPEMQITQELRDLIAQNESFNDLYQAQRDVFVSNRQIAAGQVQILQERIGQLREQENGLKRRKEAQLEQLALIQQEVKSQGELFEKGLTTQAQFMALRRDETALTGDVSMTDSQLQGVLQQIAEIEQRKLQVRRDQLAEITDGRQSVNESIFDIRSRIAAAEDVADRLTIRAPRAGRIVGLQINTVGEVISPGQKLLEIVPSDAQYVIEVKVSPNDINQVVQGGDARIRLTAYNFRTTPMVMGLVTKVSADSFLDSATGQTYFNVEVRVNPGELEALSHVEAVPGMPAQVMIATGEQTVADYLLRPILGGFEVALSESE